jgi:hypothetical protein
MTGSPEPEKETVRIIGSPARKPLSTPPFTERETVRIHLPKRPPPDPSPPSNSASPVLATAAAMPTPVTAHAPEKETSRFAVLSDPPIEPAVEASVSEVTIAPQMRIDDIPTSLYWALLATSATILILQIWNYLS